MIPNPLPVVTHTSKQPRRNARDYKNLSRVKIFNHFKTELKKAQPGHEFTEFLQKGIFTWIKHLFKSGFGKKHEYTVWPPGGFVGIYPIQPSPVARREGVVIAVAADWATDTVESFAIGAQMAGHHPEYTIHLGDTYYVGAPSEVEANFLPVGNSPWPRGSRGSFALLGNHEMYSRGYAYFREVLKSFGATMPDGRHEPQQAPFFCLENEHWCILGLDTGYNSVGFLDLGSDGRFEPALLDWLGSQVFSRPKKGLLILTHHQYITAFHHEVEYRRPAAQLATYIGKDKPVLWLWGHEHKFSLYAKAQIGEGITAYGRCIGHGGMPIELAGRDFRRAPGREGSDKLVAVDTREYPNPYGLTLGFNGYALVRIAGRRLTIEYHDLHRPLLTETWLHTGEGAIEAESIDCLQPGLDCEEGKGWADAIRK